MQKLSFLTRKIDVQTSNSLKLDAWLSMSHCCYYWSVTKPCPTLSDPMDWGFPVLHYLLELAQTHFHWVDDAIQPSHPLLPRFPPALSLSQHQGLFQWVSSSHQGANIVELQHQSFSEYSGLVSFRSYIYKTWFLNSETLNVKAWPWRIQFGP